jgi:hypothetical protein
VRPRLRAHCCATTATAVAAAVTFSAGGAAPTLLYREYQEHFGLTALMITIIFAAMSLLLALLTVGSLSDYTGRWGVSAAIGVTTGGRLNDGLGSSRVIVSALALLAASFVAMSVSAYLPAPAAARVPVLLAIVIWGLADWSYFPAQQARLFGGVGVKLASVVLSLNASFTRASR